MTGHRLYQRRSAQQRRRRCVKSCDAVNIADSRWILAGVRSKDTKSVVLRHGLELRVFNVLH